MTPAECARQLKERFPALFGSSPKPLKLRIQADIQERAPGVFTKQALSAFLRRYTGGTAYLIALSRAKHRFDLDGQPAGDLTDEHRQVADEELKRRRAVTDERRALEEQQWLNRAHLLRDFEATTLTRPNFCALKGVEEDKLDGLLEIARKERTEWEANRPAPGSERRAPRPGGPRGEGAGAQQRPRREGERAPRGEGRGDGGPRRQRPAR